MPLMPLYMPHYMPFKTTYKYLTVYTDSLCGRQQKLCYILLWKITIGLMRIKAKEEAVA